MLRESPKSGELQLFKVPEDPGTKEISLSGVPYSLFLSSALPANRSLPPLTQDHVYATRIHCFSESCGSGKRDSVAEVSELRTLDWEPADRTLSHGALQGKHKISVPCLCLCATWPKSCPQSSYRRAVHTTCPTAIPSPVGSALNYSALRWTLVGLEKGSHGPMSPGRMLQTWTSFFPQNCAILVSLSALPAHSTDGSLRGLSLTHTTPAGSWTYVGLDFRVTGCISMLSVSWGCWGATR